MVPKGDFLTKEIPVGSSMSIPAREKSDGKVNWIQTDPAKGWNMLWRIYGPTQVW